RTYPATPHMSAHCHAADMSVGKQAARTDRNAVRRIRDGMNAYSIHVVHFLFFRDMLFLHEDFVADRRCVLAANRPVSDGDAVSLLDLLAHGAVLQNRHRSFRQIYRARPVSHLRHGPSIWPPKTSGKP